MIGSGLAGLVVGSQLTGDYEILEREERVGGLCRTFERDGFRYDVGPHACFSSNKPVLARMVGWMRGNSRAVRRQNRVRIGESMCGYPIESNLQDLPPEYRAEALLGLIMARAGDAQRWVDDIHNTCVADEIARAFGPMLCDLYMRPFNEKIWKRSLRDLAPLSDRIPRVDVGDVVRNVCGVRVEGFKTQALFAYPERGGIEAMLGELKAATAAKTRRCLVDRIERSGKTWRVNGEDYDRIVSTIPPERLIDAMLTGGVDVHANIAVAARNLDYNSLRLVVFGLDRPMSDLTAIYVPDPDVIFHRVSFMGAFSPTMVPAGCGSAMCEVTCKPGDLTYRAFDETLIEKCRDGLRRIGVLHDSDRIVMTEVRREEYAYPVATHDSEWARECVLGWLKQRGVDCVGRFGSWRYQNMDAVIADALDLAGRLNHD